MFTIIIAFYVSRFGLENENEEVFISEVLHYSPRVGQIEDNVLWFRVSHLVSLIDSGLVINQLVSVGIFE